MSAVGTVLGTGTRSEVEALSQSPGGEALYMHQLPSGDVVTADSAEKVIRVCPYMARMAIEAPGQFNTLLQLASLGNQLMATPSEADHGLLEQPAELSEKTASTDALGTFNLQWSTHPTQAIDAMVMVEERALEAAHHEAVQRLQSFDIMADPDAPPVIVIAPQGTDEGDREMDDVERQEPTVATIVTNDRITESVSPRYIAPHPPAQEAKAIEVAVIEPTKPKKLSRHVPATSIPKATSQPDESEPKVIKNLQPLEARAVADVAQEETEPEPVTATRLVVDQPIGEQATNASRLYVYLSQLPQTEIGENANSDELLPLTVELDAELWQPEELEAQLEVWGEAAVVTAEEQGESESPLGYTLARLFNQAQGERGGDFPTETQELLEEIVALVFPEVELDCLYDKQTIMTVEVVDKLTQLVRLLGYEQPEEVIVEFVRHHTLATLLSTLAYLARLDRAGDRRVRQTMVSTGISSLPLSRNLRASIGALLCKIIVGNNTPQHRNLSVKSALKLRLWFR